MSTAVLADIGGTNARFALTRDGEVHAETHLKVADYAGPAEALRDFLDRAGPDPVPQRAALAIAAPVESEVVPLTNSPWVVASDEIKAALGFESLTLINDFGAIAWAIPRLSEADLAPIGGGRSAAGAPFAVIGPGTGLGVAGMVSTEAGPAVLATEGGHVTMPAADARDEAILGHLRRRLGHVSAERVLSGGGLTRLYETVRDLDGQPAPDRGADAITKHALAGDCPVSVAALDAFCAMLGTVAGNLALTLGAHGGVYLAGGIPPRILEYLRRSDFRARFEAKGRFCDYLATIPTSVIVHPDPAFVGLVHLLEWQDGRGAL